MAKAFKCDRCGIYFDPYSNVPDYKVIDMSNLPGTLDFCLPCTIALKDWMDLPARTKRKDLDNYRGAVEAKKQEKLSKTLDEMAEKRCEI